MILVSSLLNDVVNECADHAKYNRGIFEQVDERSAFVLRGNGGIGA
jgi:hypothetical protein